MHTRRIYFTQESITMILEYIVQKEVGYQEVLKKSLEAMMRAERKQQNRKKGDMSVEYRIR